MLGALDVGKRARIAPGRQRKESDGFGALISGEVQRLYNSASRLRGELVLKA
jgi:hypothetical protein